MPILSNILLETRKDAVKIAATDLDHGIQTEVPAKVTRGGAITLPARLLTEIVANLPSAEVQVSTKEGSHEVEVECGRVSYELIGLPAADFPLMPEPDGASIASLDAGLLRAMIRQTHLRYPRTKPEYS
jgi:DNA polymerase-3 subunit beta